MDILPRSIARLFARPLRARGVIGVSSAVAGFVAVVLAARAQPLALFVIASGAAALVVRVVALSRAFMHASVPRTIRLERRNARAVHHRRHG
jgi:uncharacterized membrane protein